MMTEKLVVWCRDKNLSLLTLGVSREGVFYVCLSKSHRLKSNRALLFQRKHPITKMDKL